MTHFSAAQRLVDLQVGEQRRQGKVEQNHFFHGMVWFSLARVSESGSGPVEADIWAMPTEALGSAKEAHRQWPEGRSEQGKGWPSHDCALPHK